MCENWPQMTEGGSIEPERKAVNGGTDGRKPMECFSLPLRPLNPPARLPSLFMFLALKLFFLGRPAIRLRPDDDCCCCSFRFSAATTPRRDNKITLGLYFPLPGHFGICSVSVSGRRSSVHFVAVNLIESPVGKAFQFRRNLEHDGWTFYLFFFFLVSFVWHAGGHFPGGDFWSFKASFPVSGCAFICEEVKFYCERAF